jgi:predicted DNA-binding transcriptional regulator YafY
VKPDASPTARALLALELIQGSPGIAADQLAGQLGVSGRAARYVGILREAGIPVESVRGPHSGYRIGRGLRLPPLMFTVAEALGLVSGGREPGSLTPPRSTGPARKIPGPDSPRHRGSAPPARRAFR